MSLAVSNNNSDNNIGSSYETFVNNSERELNNSVSVDINELPEKNIKTKKEKRHLKRKICFGISLFLLIIILGCVIGFFIYVSIYYHATSNALAYLKDKDNVKVKEVNSGYYFDGPGHDKALIFYPGAKVEETAYSNIIHGIAKNGIDCFLVKMPFRLGFFGINKANKIIEENKELYHHWYIAGHSLGGAMAGYYISNHQDSVEGFALLGAYTTNQIPDKVKTISLIASNDKILNWDNYHKNIKNLPGNFTEINIEGGNHSQFGNYGHQNGDGSATISMEEQHNIIINAIIDAFK